MNHESKLLAAYRAANVVQIETCAQLLHAFAFGMRHDWPLHSRLSKAVHALIASVQAHCEGLKVIPAKTPAIGFDPSLVCFLFGSGGVAVEGTVQLIDSMARLLDGLALDRQVSAEVLAEYVPDDDQRAEILKTLEEPTISEAVHRLRWACGRFLEAEKRAA